MDLAPLIFIIETLLRYHLSWNKIPHTFNQKVMDYIRAGRWFNKAEQLCTYGVI